MEEQKATKVTLYLSPDLHRKLKIRAAVDGEAMSDIASRAINFYLAHSEVVDEGFETLYGHTHKVYDCPSCTTPVVVHEGELVEIARLPGSSSVATLEPTEIPEMVGQSGQLEEGTLVVC
jgi:hypothetical protein